MQPQSLERDPQEFPRRLGRVPLSLMRGIEHETDLSLLMAAREPEQRAVADQLVRRLQDGGEPESVAVSAERLHAQPLVEGGARLLLGERIFVEIPDHVRVSVDGQHRIDVAGNEHSQGQPLRLQRPGGLVARPQIRRHPAGAPNAWNGSATYVPRNAIQSGSARRTASSSFTSHDRCRNACSSTCATPIS